MTVYGGDVIFAADLNYIFDRLGRIDETTATSDSSATSGTTELTIETLTAPVVSGRTYRVTWVTNWQGSVANDLFLMRIRAAGNQITYDTAVIASTSAIEQDTVTAEYTASATGNVAFTGTFQRSSGTGTLTGRGSATQRRILSLDYVSG